MASAYTLYAKAFLRTRRSQLILWLLVSSWLLVFLAAASPGLVRVLVSSLPPLHGMYTELRLSPCSGCEEACIATCRVSLGNASQTVFVVVTGSRVYAYLPVARHTWLVARGLAVWCGDARITGWRVLGPGIVYAEAAAQQLSCMERVWLRTTARGDVALRVIRGLWMGFSESIARIGSLLAAVVGVVGMAAEAYNAAGLCEAYRAPVYLGTSQRRRVVYVFLGLAVHSAAALMLATGLGLALLHSMLWAMAQLWGYLVPSILVAPEPRVMIAALASSISSALGAAVLGERVCRAQH